MEIEALSRKNESLLTVLQSNATDSEKQRIEQEESAKILLIIKKLYLRQLYMELDDERFSMS